MAYPNFFSVAANATASGTWRASAFGGCTLAQQPGFASLTPVVRAGNAGNADNFYAFAKTNSKNVALTCSIQKNGVTGNLSVSIPAATTGVFSDLVGADALAAGNTYEGSLAWTGATATGSATVECSFRLSPTSGNPIKLHSAAGSDSSSNVLISAASTTYFLPVNGQLDVTLTIGTTEFPTYANQAMTLQGLVVYLQTNGHTVSTLKSRKNGADGAMSVSLTASTTGRYEDTTHTDTVVAGDRFGLAIALGTGTGQMKPVTSGISTAYVGTGYVPSFNSGKNKTLSVNAVFYPWGSFDQASQHVIMPMDVVVSDLAINVATNASTGPFVVGSQLAGDTVDGDLAVTIPTATTGLFQSSGVSDSLLAGDTYRFKVRSGTGTAPVANSVAVLMPGALAAAAGGGGRMFLGL